MNFFIALFFLLCVWFLYPVLLRIVSILYSNKSYVLSKNTDEVVSVVIAVHNEAENIKSRLENLYASEYPAEFIEVVVVSDGSNDATVSIVKELKEHYLKLELVEVTPQQGRSNAHNLAVPQCSGEILVFTDAETVFEQGFLRKIVMPFANEGVGFASGVLRYRNAKNSQVTESAGLYWRFEYFLRRLESELGLYVFGTGACCAVRRKLYKAIPPTGDVDFTTPLDVVMQGYCCVHVEDAVAHEVMPDTSGREFRARVRMTAKNLYGTVTRWGIKGLFEHPIYSLVLFFHKIGRWFTPFAMIGLFISNIFLLGMNIGYDLFFFSQVIFYLIAICGYFRLPIPLAGQAYSFCLANAGFFVGVIKAVMGRVPSAYKPVSRS